MSDMRVLFIFGVMAAVAIWICGGEPEERCVSLGHVELGGECP